MRHTKFYHTKITSMVFSSSEIGIAVAESSVPVVWIKAITVSIVGVAAHKGKDGRGGGDATISLSDTVEETSLTRRALTIIYWRCGLGGPEKCVGVGNAHGSLGGGMKHV